MMGVSQLWTSDYIGYSYDHFLAWSPNRNKTKDFYQQKQQILRKQHSMMKAREKSVIATASDEGFEDLMDILMNQGPEALFGSYGNTERTAGDITVGAASGVKSPGGKSVSFYTAHKYIGEAKDLVATGYSYVSHLERYISNLISELTVGSDAYGSFLLQKMQSNPGSLTKKEQATVRRYVKESMGAFAVSSKDNQKIVRQIKELQALRQKMKSLLQSGGLTPEVATDIASEVRLGIISITEKGTEICAGMMLAQGYGVIQKAMGEHLRDTVLSIRNTGGERMAPTHSNAYDELIEQGNLDIKDTSGLTVQQTTDMRFVFQRGSATFTLGGSIKRYTYGSLRKFKLGLKGTTLLLAMDDGGILDDSALVNALMNTAAGHAAEDLDTSMPSFSNLKQNTYERGITNEWNKVKDTVAASILFTSLAGNRTGDKDTIILVVNNKALLMSDVLEKIADNPNLIGNHSSSGRYAYVNQYDQREGPNRVAAKERSATTFTNLISQWRSENFSVTIDYLKGFDW
jgi:hypothetical protein